jgi:hypothetical protein
MSDLFEALKMLKGSMQEFAVNRAVTDSKQKLDQINATFAAAKPDEIDPVTGMSAAGAKYQAQKSAANDLALQLSGLGAPAATIQSAFGAIAPPEFKSAEQAQGQGILERTGSQMAAGAQVMQTKQDLEMQQTRQSQQFQAAENAKNRELQKELAGMKVNGKTVKPMPSAQLERIQGLDERISEGTSLLAELNSNPKSQEYLGMLSGRDPLGIRSKITNPEFGAFKARTQRFFDAYRTAVTGAAASEKELELLESRMPNNTDSPELYMSKLRDVIKYGKDIRKKRLQNLGKAGYNTSGFLGEEEEEQQAKTVDPAAAWLANPANQRHPNYNAVKAKYERSQAGR